MVSVFGRRFGGDGNGNGNGDGSAASAGDAGSLLDRQLTSGDPAQTGLASEHRRQNLEEAKTRVFGALLSTVDLSQISRLNPETAAEEMSELAREIIREFELPLSESEQSELITDIVNDTFGLGPIEPLLMDEDISDIMINSPDAVFIERNGLIKPANIHFRDRAQLMNICMRIAMAVGRRIDESSPICDARLADGSRVNIIIPPLSLGSPMLTIRKFHKRHLSLADMVDLKSMTPEVVRVLEIAVEARANILVSGGTGSGKTTLLNAMCQHIPSTERIITVEDTAELRLQQANVGRLETRPANIEGVGEVTQRDLVRNCLRMRPDRILVGEVRGPEAFDMLQAMNTGHEGSMSTVHANTPRDSLTRLEDMVAMSGLNLPAHNVRMQVASAIDIVIQAERMRDGVRRITHITEVIGVGDRDYVLQNLFEFEHQGLDGNGGVMGELRTTRLPPRFLTKAHRVGKAEALLDAMGCSAYRDDQGRGEESDAIDDDNGVIRLDTERQA